jgi:hypothetical protein
VIANDLIQVIFKDMDVTPKVFNRIIKNALV